ncbi:hypothetical protein EB118_05345 [bacterium]|nr:hypothetical protein [bacterium]NDC93761.1 hypothetical protein [bacterium]NDD83094.1 hypothetical protein [bacterium]NDG29509.1 hypothetical protein [bacterium]
MSRSFTVESVYRSGTRKSFSGGRYISDTPSGAAKKAFSQAYKSLRDKSGRVSLEINIRETTRGSLGKTFSYRVTRVYDPVEVYRKGELITYDYTTKIKSLN